ncbi:MAG: ABC transporter ATP-binding protein [Clostridia bacterium]|nr:ABC transporter ATP-binding protein [Clostridia bacterium]
MSIVQFENVSRIYTSGDHELRALDHVSFTLDEGKFVVILGPSGAGKSTLLNLLGGLDSPSEGTITVNGADISKLTDNELADYRASTVGFVFRFYNLIPTLTVYENVKLVSEISKNALGAKDMIDKVGLLDHLNNFPSELSGGEQQRISIARAIMKDAPIIILDEATANVDPENEKELTEAIGNLTKQKTIIMIAHRLKTVRGADQIIVIDKGKIVQKGKHDELVKQDGIYRSFITGRRQAVSWKLS